MKKNQVSRVIPRAVIVMILLLIIVPSVVMSAPGRKISSLQSPRYIGGLSGKNDQRDVDMYPAVAYDAVQGRHLAVWLSPRNARSSSSGFDVYGVFINPSGLRLGAPFRISDSNSVARNGLPTVAAGRGEFVVGWTARTNRCEIMVQRVINARNETDHVLISSNERRHSPNLVYNGGKNAFLLVQSVGDDYLPPTLFGAETADCGNSRDSNSRIEAIEFSMRGDSPKVAKVSKVSNRSAGAFRPDVAYDRFSNRYVVVWEDRRHSKGEFDFAVYGQILEQNLSAKGTNFKLAPNADYVNFSKETTWTPRPRAAFGSNALFAVWFERQAIGGSTTWSIVGKLFKTTGATIKEFRIAENVYGEIGTGQSPAGFLDMIYVRSLNEYLVASSMYQDTFAGYLSTATIQRVNSAGRLLDLEGRIQGEVGSGTIIDYALDDQLGAAVAVREQSLPIADYTVLYAKHAPTGHARDFDIWGVPVNIQSDGLQKMHLPIVVGR